MSDVELGPEAAAESSGKDSKDIELASTNVNTTRPWQHAAYHSIVSVLGVAGLVALPYSMAYLGWAGGLILFATATATSFYSGQLLINCQDIVWPARWQQPRLCHWRLGKLWHCSLRVWRSLRDPRCTPLTRTRNGT